MAENKDHWYDGRFYDIVIAPNQDAMFQRVKDLVREGSTVLDVGCGTGRLAFQLAEKCRHIDGVDQSERNVAVARDKLARHSAKNIDFHHADVFQFLRESPTRFDVAILTYVVHEMDRSLRLDLLAVLAESAREIIIVDYLAPQPRNFAGLLNELIEYVAGIDHYRNFRSFLQAQGLSGLGRSAGLSVMREERNSPPGTHTVVLAGTVISPSDVCW
jgi:SAM-dependent methyltransferase